MSTSSDFSWATAQAGIRSFEYPAAKTAIPPKFDPTGRGDQRNTDPLKQLQQARQEGQREGELRARKIFEDSLQSEREQLRQALKDFQAERKAYFRRVETEAVQLSLAIARKILHREAQIDPSLLAKLARVAIEQLTDSTGIVLRVNMTREQEWKEFFAHSDLTPAPQVIGDGAVDPDHCVLSTQLGSTEIGIECQLKEIQQGLFDLMAQRPEA